jgi:predicted Zn-dependent protease
MSERNRDEALRGLVQALLGAAEAEHVEIWFGDSHGASTRFSNNAITQNIAKRDASIQIRAAYGKCVGAAGTNDLSEASLLATLRRAEAAARASAEDLEYLPPPGPQVYPKVEAFDPAVAALTPEERAGVVADAVSVAREAGAESFGSFASGRSRDRCWNSNGLVFDHERTSLLYANTFAGPATTGWAKRWSHTVSGLDAPGAARAACDKATRFSEVTDFEPGPCTVVLEPSAFSDLLLWFQWTIDAKQADEGWSAWQGKVGTEVASPMLTMRSQPGHPRLPGYPCVEDGLAAPTVTWVDKGVLKSLSYSRFWALKSGVEPTGYPGNFVVETETPGQGTKSVEELVRGVERGILVTRFWYLNFVDEMSLSITGMTRDGLFRIEDGEVVGALRNMRFNDSPLGFLKRVTEVGRPEVTVGDSDDPVLCPPVRIEDFHFTSGTSF